MSENEDKNLIPVDISSELKSSYIDYSMSVIVSRALPDARDGLKPVHRRVLYGMHMLSNFSYRPYKKSATVVGEVLGKYHPHGDTSIYDTMVRMAQPWSLRYLMVDGHGNFGSVDGDSPAAMRYTEARLQTLAEQMLVDIDKDTVDFKPNFDETQKEPVVLPSRLPNLLINGSSGIAVGMATNMAPHNLSDVIDAVIAYIDDSGVDAEDLINIIKAPDFPTGGMIYGYHGVRNAYLTGRGRVLLRAKYDLEDLEGGRVSIIVSEIPYQVNKAEMIKKTADLINNKKIEGIATIRDESDRNGMRIVYVLKRDAVVDVVVNNLFKQTNLQTSFSVNNVALVDGRPQILNLKELIGCFVDHRFEVLIRRTNFELVQARARLHILEGLLVAIDHLDDVIAMIRRAGNRDEARSALMTTYELSQLQANAILALRLQQLTALERDAVRNEHESLLEKVAYLNRILNEESLRKSILKEDFLDIKDRFGDQRRTEINYSGGEFSIEDMIPNDDMVVTLSEAGYIKRVPESEYKVQNRGGVGKQSSSVRDQDFIKATYVCKNHQYVLLFTQMGRCFWMRVFDMPEGSRISKGRAIQNLIQIESEDRVCTMILIDNIKDPEFLKNHYVTMVTRKGVIKKTSLSLYSRPRSSGVKAVGIREGDVLLEAILTDGAGDVMIATRYGKAIRFSEKTLRAIGRTASGVRGVTLSGDDDEVVGVIHLSDDTIRTQSKDVLVLSEHGFGKRTAISEYRITGRGGKGVITINTTDKVGGLVAIKAVKDDDELVVVNKSGLLLRLAVNGIRITGRNAQGVRVIKLRKADAIAAVTRIDTDLIAPSEEMVADVPVEE